jgi:hypothetical protein
MKLISYYIDKNNRIFEITRTDKLIKFRLLTDKPVKQIEQRYIIDKLNELELELLNIP